jgi:APA family basic amino acid/polyamine antiporter
MRTFKDLNVLQRFIIPSLAALGSLFIIYAAVQKDLFIYFLVATIVILVVGYFLDTKRVNKKQS